MTSSTTVQIPGYVVGTWDIDAAHSTVGFSVRHMMVSKVRGYFREFSGEIVTAEDPDESSVTATVNMDSIDTRQEQRDAHIRSADFFDVGNHTEMTFRSTECPHRRRRLDRRGRPHHQGHHQAGQAGAGAQRLRSGRLRRHPRRLLRQDRDLPQGLRRRHRHADGRRRRRRQRQDHRRARDRGRAPHRLRKDLPSVPTARSPRATWRRAACRSPEGPGRCCPGPSSASQARHRWLPGLPQVGGRPSRRARERGSARGWPPPPGSCWAACSSSRGRSRSPTRPPPSARCGPTSCCPSRSSLRSPSACPSSRSRSGWR